jgi:eukaryotic-like serine/threonine-protein kinase
VRSPWQPLYPPPPVRPSVNQGVKPQSPKPIQQPVKKQIKTPSRGIDRRNFSKWLGFGGVGVVSILTLSQIGKNPPLDKSDSDSNAPESASNLPKLTKISFTSVKLNNQGNVIDKPAGSAEIFTESLSNHVELTMVKIPAGKFLMGSLDSEQYRDEYESPQHQVNVSEFYLGRTLVTQSQWTAIMGKNPSHFKGNDKLPVEQVSWLDAMNFCQKLSQTTGRTYRLPSEAEWEYACRAGTTTPFAFGETITPAVINYNGNYLYGAEAKGESRGKTTPIGTFPPNLFGLYDLHGNLWEWCLDEWVNNYNGASTDGSARGDISLRDKNKNRLLRGGSWFNNASSCRSANRNYNAASYSNDIIGFRVVCEPSRTP